ncbi:ring-h2 finger protein atl32-like [Stylonychia lemnae]|uniref:Ring-h2 finger protein atl32-like n=1 Tax=Stylonychia lemnae TaxID=5949 RepID=A0A078AMA7_STYLE|nr:ring-h2 finger protein atl32-like [Stylonychia lemnae]|eukprot:CDW83530.1 ring-h2 finger protein atl32-like [Stylonychia lemnae]
MIQEHTQLSFYSLIVLVVKLEIVERADTGIIIIENSIPGRATDKVKTTDFPSQLRITFNMHDIYIDEISNTENDEQSHRNLQVNTVLNSQPSSSRNSQNVPKKKQRKLEKLMLTFTMKGEFDKGFAEFGENNCVICFDDYVNNKIIRKINRCGHLFHSECLDNWIIQHLSDPKCPLCNLNIKFDDERENN